MSSVNNVDYQQSVEELSSLVFDGKFNDYHKKVRDLLLDPIFDAKSGLNLQQAGKLAYERSRFINKEVGGPMSMMEDPNFLYVLSEWPSVLDVSVFSLLMVHYNLSFGTLYDHGKDRADSDLKSYFDELNELKSFSPYMATELGYGNNVAQLKTEAIYNHEERNFTLRTPDMKSLKHMSYSGFKDVPKVAIVLAKLIVDGSNKGVFPFLVRISDLNGSIEGVEAVPCPEKPVQGLDNGLTAFRDLKLPFENLLFGDMGIIDEDGKFKTNMKSSRKRFLRTMSRIVPGRLCVSSSALGAGKSSVYITVKYGLQRKTNAPGTNELPIIDYLNYQVDVFGALSKVFASNFLTNYSKNQYAEGSMSEADMGTLISMTKAIVTWEMTDVVAICRERCGAQGIFSANRIADYGSLLQGLVTAEGDDQVLLGNAAGQVIAQPAPEVVGPEASGIERNINNIDCQINLLTCSENALWKKASDKASSTEVGSFFDSINSALPFGLEMLRARAARMSLEQYQVAINTANCPNLKEGLTALATLYGLIKLKAHAASHLTSEELTSIDENMHKQCSIIRPHASLLVDGFELSPQLLRVPIAQDDYVTAFHQAAVTCGEETK